jgi:hypothetical protein
MRCASPSHLLQSARAGGTSRLLEGCLVSGDGHGESIIHRRPTFRNSISSARKICLTRCIQPKKIDICTPLESDGDSCHRHQLVPQVTVRSIHGPNPSGVVHRKGHSLRSRTKENQQWNPFMPITVMVHLSSRDERHTMSILCVQSSFGDPDGTEYGLIPSFPGVNRRF